MRRMTREDKPPDIREDGPNIGPTLLEARTEKGLSLDDVEQATKIRKRYIEGLERDDYTVLPDAVYVQGFLKTYANYLGLDGEEISGRLKKRRTPRRERQISQNLSPKKNYEPSLLSPGGVSGARKRRISGATILAVVIAIFVLAAVIGALYYVGRGSLPAVASNNDGNEQPIVKSQGSEDDSSNDPEPKQDSDASDSQASEKKQPAPEKESEKASTGNKSAASGAKSDDKPAKKSAAKPPENLQVEIRVVDSASWISVLTDGEVAFNELGDVGFSQVFEADEAVSLSVGNAGSVRVKVNGQDVGTLGEPGEVLTRNFNKKTAG